MTADPATLDLILRSARSFDRYTDRPVSDETLAAVWDLTKWGPTSANGQPARILFLKSQEQKERLRPALSATNLDKTLAAPVVAIVAHDTRFFEHLPRYFPKAPDARSWFEGKPHAGITAFRNGTLQGAYFLIAARAVGLDCGPMSGFDNAVVDAEFFPDGRLQSNFLCCLGYGDRSALKEQAPRMSFDEACEIL